MFAQALDKMRDYGPKAVALDFSFVGESPNPEDDVIFSQALEKSKNVILASYFDPRGKPLLPLKMLSDKSLAYGPVNKPRDKDAYVRQSRAFLVSKVTGKPVEYSFEVKIFAQYLGAPLQKITYNGKEILFKKSDQALALIPVKKDGIMPVNFQAKLRDFPIVSFWKVLKKDLPPQTFKDKIILVGPISELFHDIHNTPLGLMPGAVINANTLLTFLSRNFIQYLPKNLEFFLILILGLSATLITYILSPLASLLITFLGVLVYLGIGFNFFLKDFRMDYFGGSFMMVLAYAQVTIYKYIRLWIESATLKTLAITDGLTGLYIHRYFSIRLQNEFDRASRYNLYFSLVIMDIDHFKSINDTYGHEQGNVVLKNIAKILQEQSRKTDFVARYGGEEFCAVLTHTNLAGAIYYAERVRQAVEAFAFPAKSGKPLKVAISLGVVNYPKFKASKVEELIEAADKALYQAKESGRNRVCVFEEKTGGNNER